MSSAFIPHRAGTDPQHDTIARPDDFYPQLRVSDWKARVRVDDNVSAKRSHEILTTALYMIHGELAAWRGKQTAPALTDTQAIHYRSAVYQRAKAYELEQYRDIDSTDAGARRAEGLESRIDTALQRSREHLRALIQKNRATIRLI